MLRDGRLVGLQCDGADRCGLTEAMGDVGVGGVGHGRGERDRWCPIQKGWSWKFCWHMGRTVIGAWPGPWIFGCISTIVQWCVLHWGTTCFMVENFVYNVTEKSESKTNYRFQTNCECTVVIQNICVPPPWKIGTCAWCGATWRTTWFPCRTTTTWRAPFVSEYFLGQSRNNRFSGVEHQLGHVQGIWPGTLPSIVGSLVWARSSWTFDLVFTTGVLRTAWWNCRWLRSEWPIPDHGQCATRLRSQSTVILCCFGICHAKMEECRWSGWHRSDGWGSKFAWFTLRGWHSDFCSLTSWIGTFDRFIDDTFGAGRFAVQCGEDCGDN